MHYPTHSTSGPVCVMGAHAVKVTAYGYRNRNDAPFFGDCAFSNEVALFRMSNRATVRVCECREIARRGREGFSILGTRGSFLDGTWQENQREAPLTAHPLQVTELTVDAMRDPLPADVYEAFAAGSTGGDVYGGHGGSHAYLVHEFVGSVAGGRQPAINAWEAVRYMAMGVMAHKSALRDGETLDVPDWGDAPE
jgi:predicted dehydrogenase